MTELKDFKTGFLNHLDQIVFFLDYRGENPFKIRAFRMASELLMPISNKDLQTKIEDESLLEIKGIGRGILSVAKAFLKTEDSPELKAARGDLPLSLLELADIRGLGAKKIKILVDELQIKSLGELEYACVENRLVKLKGFGEKTQEKILKEIQHTKFRRGKQLLSDALMVALHVETELGKKIQFRRVGDLGRKLEIVESVDYLIRSSDPKKFLSALKKNSFADNLNVVDHHAKLKLDENTEVGFYFATNDSFIVESIRRTSSEIHWKSLEEVAQQKGMNLSSDNLRKGKENLSFNSEAEFYKALELPFHPAEAREFECKKEEFHFCSNEDLTGVFHFHTTYSDGVGSVEEMAEAARKHGWSYAGLSDHSKTASYAQGLDEKSLAAQWKEVDALNKKSKEFRIFKGIESDILKDGKLDYDANTLKKFDFVIASIHSRYGMTEMTNRIIKAIENPHTTMIGHLSGRLLLARPGYELDYPKILDACISNKKILELNSNPHRLDADWRHLYRACEKGLLISINPDAHSTRGFEDFEYGIWMSRKAMIPKEQIFNTWPREKIEKHLGL